MLNTKWTPVVACCSALCFAQPSWATAPINKIGTLSCTVAPAKAAAAGSKRQLSCSFQPLNGPRSDYSGYIKRTRGQPLSQAKLVLVWSVLAPPHKSAHALGGRYLSSLTQASGPSAGKVGAMFRDGSERVELRSVTQPGGAANNRSVIIELELDLAKA